MLRCCPALPCPALPCPALPCPALPCPALPCPALTCPVLSCTHAVFLYCVVLCCTVPAVLWPDLKGRCVELLGCGGAGEQAELLPCDAEIERVLGVSLRGVEGMDKSVRQVLGGDTSAISTLRCLKLYLERMGTDFQNASELHRIAGDTPFPGVPTCRPSFTPQSQRSLQALGMLKPLRVFKFSFLWGRFNRVQHVEVSFACCDLQ